MDKIKNIDDVMVRLEELKSSLNFSTEIFPLFSDIFLFIKDIIPLMLEANASLRESTKKIPTASESLNDISQATELATNQVLDKLDDITNEMENLKNKISSGTSKKEQIKLLDKMQNETSEIVYAFQFQDITTQKLEHVNRILEAIYDKFMVLFKSFKKLKDNTDLGGQIIRAIENELDMLGDDKTKEYFDSKTEDVIHQNGFSQEDIDRFFK